MWSFKGFRSSDCKDYYSDISFTEIDKYAILLSMVAAISLLMIMFPICCLKDPSRLITPHPLMILAQICFLQALLYYWFITANIPTFCKLLDFNVIEPMAGWVPF